MSIGSLSNVRGISPDFDCYCGSDSIEFEFIEVNSSMDNLNLLEFTFDPKNLVVKLHLEALWAFKLDPVIDFLAEVLPRPVEVGG